MKNHYNKSLVLVLLVTLSLPVVTFAQGIVIKSGGYMVASGNAYVVVNNTGFSNSGTFTAASSTVLFANTSTISGTTNFNNVTISTGTLTPAASCIMRIAGVLTNSGTLQALTNNNTIDYNGTNQTVINPNGGATGYYNLSLSGSGVKTLPLTTFNIIGNLSLSGSAATTTTKDLIVSANLNLSNTSVLTIGAAKTFTVSGTIANTAGSGSLVLQSNASGTASLIHNSDNVPATVQRYISGATEDWHFLSSPISNQSISGSWLPSGTYGNDTGYDLYVWDEPTPCWVYKLNTTATPNWPTVHPSANFVSGRGYLYSVQARSNPIKEFVGNLNNGTITYPLTANSTVDPLLTGFNLIGNPYSSSIDWKASSGWTRSNLLNSGGGYDMWIWNPAAQNYGVFNSLGSTGTNGVTQYIPPMQGFFVRAASNANISMTNNIRLHTGASNWMKLSNRKNTISNLKVRIASDSGLGFDEVLLQFGYNSNEVGAAKLFSTSKTAPSTYFKEGKEDLSVRYLTNTNDNPIIPLMFKPGSDGNYTLNTGLDYIGFDYIVLEDKKTKTLHNLLENPTYQFKGLLKDDPNRFILYFTPKESITEDNLSTLIYYNGNDLVVDLTKVQEQTEVKAYDILGKVLLNKTVEGNTIQHFPMSKTTQMLIVVAKSKTKIMRCKVLIH